MANLQPYVAPTVQSKLETTATLANAIQLTKMIFKEISGNEISTMEHDDGDLEAMIAAAMNQELTLK